jgi:hypothetical protein
MSQGSKFDHISLRVDRETKTQLEKEARQRKINLNSLVNLVLSKHVSFDRIVEHTEAIPLNKALFIGIIEAIQIEEVERIGRELGPRVVKQTFAFLGLDFNLEGLIEHYFQPVSTFSRWYSFNVTGSGANRRLMFEHQYGRKWSAFLKQYIGGIIKSATGTEPKITVDDGLVTVFC